MSKKKHSAYKIEFKLQILSEVEEKKLSKTEICKKHNIPNSTLSTILKDREKLQKAHDDSKFRPATKKMIFCSHEVLEDAVFAWLCQAMVMNVPLSGPVVIGKATFSKMPGRGVEKSKCHATVSRVSPFQVDIGQVVFDLMGNLADGRHAPDMVQTKWVFKKEHYFLCLFIEEKGMESAMPTLRAFEIEKTIFSEATKTRQTTLDSFFK
ncbi:tigger transposable element-derived protein 6 [Elysia marginata]|uniref:Tigger transposable element-derived protein 6 n=1 Tax=Elysia marginata TaxID=1093978 RepID=A0AAV4HYC2_9GAST|nr:tigger transposable element-derived protein 6 [Elysia marginata]